MATFDYKQSYAWSEAMELSQGVLGLVETLPETAGNLAYQLTSLAVKVPGCVAKCLIQNEEPKLGVALRLATAVELVDRVYPALDTGSVQTQVAALLDRMQSPSFTELKPATPAPVATEESEPEEVAEPEAEADEEEEHVEPTNVKVQEE